MGIFGRRKAPAKTTDPVCGMVVVEGQAIGPDVIAGQAYWFCSAACQDEYHERTGTRLGGRRRRERDRRREKGLVH